MLQADLTNPNTHCDNDTKGYSDTTGSDTVTTAQRTTAKKFSNAFYLKQSCSNIKEGSSSRCTFFLSNASNFERDATAHMCEFCNVFWYDIIG